MLSDFILRVKLHAALDIINPRRMRSEGYSNCLSVCVCICPRPNKCTTHLYLKTTSSLGFLQHSKEIERLAFAKNVPFMSCWRKKLRRPSRRYERLLLVIALPHQLENIM